MTWHIIQSPHWEGCTHLLDTRTDARYAYDELHGAKHVCSNDDEGEVCFQLPDGTTVWLMNADLETVWPHDDNVLRTDDPSQRDYSWAQLAELTHRDQVAAFNWCSCEQGEPAYDDCPRHVRARVS